MNDKVVDKGDRAKRSSKRKETSINDWVDIAFCDKWRSEECRIRGYYCQLLRVWKTFDAIPNLPREAVNFSQPFFVQSSTKRWILVAWSRNLVFTYQPITVRVNVGLVLERYLYVAPFLGKIVRPFETTLEPNCKLFEARAKSNGCLTHLEYPRARKILEKDSFRLLTSSPSPPDLKIREKVVGLSLKIREKVLGPPRRIRENEVGPCPPREILKAQSVLNQNLSRLLVCSWIVT